MIPCKYCPTQAKSPQGLRRHMSSAHPDAVPHSQRVATTHHVSEDRATVGGTLVRDSRGRQIDYQKGRVYKAEDRMPGYRRCGHYVDSNIPGVKVFVHWTEADFIGMIRKAADELLRQGIIERSGHARMTSYGVKFTPGRGGAHAYWTRGFMSFTRQGGRSVWILCHELAHMLIHDLNFPKWAITSDPDERSPHGPEFCRVFVRLVDILISREASIALSDAFYYGNVRQ